MLEHHRRMFAYDRWAASRMRAGLGSLSAAAPDHPSVARCLRFYAHMYGSRRMWLGRIESTPDAALNTWPELTLGECDAWRAELEAKWETYLGGITDGDLNTLITYTTQAGQAGQQTVGDILTHAVLHSMHHRAQIALLLREADVAPLGLDFVVFTKETLHG